MRSLPASRLRCLLFAFVALFLSFLLADWLFPLPSAVERGRFSALVLAEDGTPLRAFADEEGVWRYPVTLAEVSPLYVEALLNYEDRWFRHHPGVNPLALVRAAWQWLRAGRVVSGGSTLTMQVARILDAHERSIGGKSWQMFRALQLEWHLDKDAILTLYLNLAPFGGPLEGVQAASFAWLGKPAASLSHAEAALLAVLPQAPSRLRPDRHPERAQAARDKVLDRMQKLGVWDAETVADARMERVGRRFDAQPLLAPLLAQRLKTRALETGRLRTTLDAGLQWSIEQRLLARLAQWPERTSAAVLVVENDTLFVRAYAGSVDFNDDSRFGHVDMVRALRSPGSTLKPFLYAIALDDGLIHSESLLVDAPQAFGGYRPGNFEGGFHGPVSVREALQRSLNVPAVDVLDRLTPERFVAIARNGGLRLQLPDGGAPNLSMILGGVGTTLENLVESYGALARGGMTGGLRFVTDDPLIERRMMGEGAAWIVRDMLESQPRPGTSPDMLLAGSRQVAWKTGTSYGYRDAWAVGVTDRYSIGVWVGRPDGTPLPGHYGAVTAAPLLFEIVDGLPGRAPFADRPARPASVEPAVICWPLGTPVDAAREDLCHQRRTAWLLNGTAPPTLPDRLRGTAGGLQRLWVNPATGRRVDAQCRVKRREAREIALWPAAVEPWLSPELRAKGRLPPVDRSCPAPPAGQGAQLSIVGVSNNSVLRRAGADGRPPLVTLRVVGGDGDVYWMVNGRMEKRAGPREAFLRRFGEPGRYEVTAMDETGRYDQVVLRVIE
ncbi:MAG: penicillin-binding protein 1C [Chromatiales bacterium]|nr:penicillin-binding protein 1C [Chromatiales bacterium]